MSVTYQHARIVYFRILGEKRDFPKVRQDDGLIGRFLKWQIETDTLPAINHTTGGGVWTGGFFPEDALKVIDWLRAEGATSEPDFYDWVMSDENEPH